jgi:hypothetical protein
MSNTSSPPGAATPVPPDDFTLIDGLGDTYAKRLYEAGVSTFAQLGAMSPAEVGEIVGLSAETIVKKGWISKAQQRASNPSASHHNTDSSGNDQRPATFTVKLLLDEENHVIRMSVRRAPDGVEEKWAGWDERRMVNFIIKHAELSIPLPEPVPQPGPPPKQPGDLTLEIIETTTREVNAIAPSSVINTNQAWLIHIKWELSGATKDELVGNWLVRAHLESIGPGQECSLPASGAVRVPLSNFVEPPGTAYTYQYTHEINVAAGTIAAGTYKLVVAITWKKEDAGPIELVSFFEGMLQFYG